MDDREPTTDDPGVEPAAPSAFAPPPMPAPLPAPSLATPAAASSSTRRFPWITVVVGVVAVAAIVALSLMLVSTSSDKNDAEEALANAQTNLTRTRSHLADSEAALSESEAALATANSDLSDSKAALADAEAAQADAEAARDEHQQRADEYEAASADLLVATIVAGAGLEDNDAQCVADGMIDSLGAEAMTILASAARDGSGDIGKLDDEMRRAGDACGIPPEAFDDPFNADANAYGDDPELDALYDDCAAGDAVACDDLYTGSAPGSEYEQFGGTCGNRFEYSATEPCEGRF